MQITGHKLDTKSNTTCSISSAVNSRPWFQVSITNVFFFSKQQLSLLLTDSQITPLSHTFNAIAFSMRCSDCTAPLLPFPCQQSLLPCCLQACILMPVSDNCSVAKAQGQPFTLSTPPSIYCSHKQNRACSVELWSLVTKIIGKMKVLSTSLP